MKLSKTLSYAAALAGLALSALVLCGPRIVHAAGGDAAGPVILNDGDTLSDLAGAPGDRKSPRGRRSRDQADRIGGSMFQIEPFWFPVRVSKNGPVRYIAGRIQLEPAEDLIVDACYRLPWITEALIFHFYRAPLDHAPEEGNADDDRRLTQIVNSWSKEPLFKRARIIPIDSVPRPISEEDRELSQVCG